MQTPSLTKWNGATPDLRPLMTVLFPARYESTPPTVAMPDIGNIDQARNALGEAARVIREQEDRIRTLESMALTDELTGLLNRRGLLACLRREHAAARRDYKACGLLIMVDLDGFKAINDIHGHAAGDEYLRAAARMLAGLVRESDVVARLGGDEFAILLTRCAADHGAGRVSQFEQFFNTQILAWTPKPVAMRGSFGFAVYTGSDTPETVIATADLKLYAHKASRKSTIRRR